MCATKLKHFSAPEEGKWTILKIKGDFEMSTDVLSNITTLAELKGYAQGKELNLNQAPQVEDDEPGRRKMRRWIRKMVDVPTLVVEERVVETPVVKETETPMAEPEGYTYQELINMGASTAQAKIMIAAGLTKAESDGVFAEEQHEELHPQPEPVHLDLEPEVEPTHVDVVQNIEPIKHVEPVVEHVDVVEHDDEVEEKETTNSNLPWLIVVGLGVILILVLLAWHPWVPSKSAPTNTPNPTQTATLRPTDRPTATTDAAVALAATATAQAALDTSATAQAPVPGSISWTDFKQMLSNQGVTDPYVLVDILDAMSQKIDHQTGNWTVTAPASLVWTGWYTIDPLPEGVYPLLVDGRTGVYIVEEGVEVPTPSGEIPLNSWDGDIPLIGIVYTQQVVDVGASNCADSEAIVGFIKTWMTVNPDEVFVSLDTYVDSVPSARLRASGPGNVTVTAYQALIWTQPTAVTSGANLILESNGKALFLVTETGTLNVTHAFSGVQLCQPINADLEIVQASVAVEVEQTGICVPLEVISSTITLNRGDLATREETLYPALDALALQYPNATTIGEPGTITGTWIHTVVWVLDGLVSDVVIALDTSANHSLWLFTSDGTAQATAPWTAITICDPGLEPERDFGWWGH